MLYKHPHCILLINSFLEIYNSGMLVTPLLGYTTMLRHYEMLSLFTYVWSRLNLPPRPALLLLTLSPHCRNADTIPVILLF